MKLQDIVSKIIPYEDGMFSFQDFIDARLNNYSSALNTFLEKLDSYPGISLDASYSLFDGLSMTGRDVVDYLSGDIDLPQEYSHITTDAFLTELISARGLQLNLPSDWALAFTNLSGQVTKLSLEDAEKIALLPAREDFSIAGIKPEYIMEQLGEGYDHMIIMLEAFKAALSDKLTTGVDRANTFVSSLRLRLGEIPQCIADAAHSVFEVLQNDAFSPAQMGEVLANFFGLIGISQNPSLSPDDIPYCSYTGMNFWSALIYKADQVITNVFTTVANTCCALLGITIPAGASFARWAYDGWGKLTGVNDSFSIDRDVTNGLLSNVFSHVIVPSKVHEDFVKTDRYTRIFMNSLTHSYYIEGTNTHDIIHWNPTSPWAVMYALIDVYADYPTIQRNIQMIDDLLDFHNIMTLTSEWPLPAAQELLERVAFHKQHTGPNTWVPRALCFVYSENPRSETTAEVAFCITALFTKLFAIQELEIMRMSYTAGDHPEDYTMVSGSLLNYQNKQFLTSVGVDWASLDAGNYGFMDPNWNPPVSAIGQITGKTALKCWLTDWWASDSTVQTYCSPYTYSSTAAATTLNSYLNAAYLRLDDVIFGYRRAASLPVGTYSIISDQDLTKMAGHLLTFGLAVVATVAAIKLAGWAKKKSFQLSAEAGAKSWDAVNLRTGVVSLDEMREAYRADRMARIITAATSAMFGGIKTVANGVISGVKTVVTTTVAAVKRAICSDHGSVKTTNLQDLSLADILLLIKGDD